MLSQIKVGLQLVDVVCVVCRDICIYLWFHGFQNLVVFCTWLVMYLVPDMPYKVKLQMLRENFLAKEALFSADTIQKQRERNNAASN